MAKLNQSYTCAKCDERITDSEELVEARHHFWHKPCYKEDFPGTGKAVPDTILSNPVEDKSDNSKN